MRLLPPISILLLALASPGFAATKAAAVIDDGYAGKVLEKILPSLTGVTQKSTARISLDGEGKYTGCSSMRGDGQSICKAAKSAGSFGDPPYGVASDILVSVWSAKGDTTAQTAAKTEQTPQPSTSGMNKSQAAYLSRVRVALRNSMYIPKETKPGTYHVTAQIKCDEKGKILERSLVKSSGDARLDRYVLQGLDRAGSVEAPPKGMNKDFNLDFTLKR